MQAIVDHHHNADVKTATKVRFQEPGKEAKEGKEGEKEDAEESHDEENKEVRAEYYL